MEKSIFTIVLLIIGLLLAIKAQTFVKNNRPAPVIVEPSIEEQFESIDMMVSSSTDIMASTTEEMATTTASTTIEQI